MAYSPNQARDQNGRFAGSGHSGDQANRDAGRSPVTSHAGAKSVGSHSGHDVTTLNERTGRFELVVHKKNLATAERLSQLQRADKKFSRIVPR